MSENVTMVQPVVQQITDQRTLRKLLRRVDEIPEVKQFLTEIVRQDEAAKEAVEKRAIDSTVPYTTAWGPDAVTRFLEMKKVKENQHMTSLLSEIKEYLAASSFEAAAKAAKRVLEAEPAQTPQKFVKEGKSETPLKEGTT